ncbi:MAG: LacI family DNA-binding transcriptional regulator [Thermomicrobiales bacterium]
MSSRRVTIDDIARESGASPTTVSLVLRDKPGIGAETRDRVLSAAQSLGYQRRPSRARSATDVRTVALLFRARHRTSEERAPGVNPFYSWVLTGIEAAAKAKRMNLLYVTVPVDTRNEIVDLPTHTLDQPLDGVLAIGPFRPAGMEQMARANPAPLVALDGPATERGWSGVVSDNVEGAAVATRYLIEQGHRRIGLLSPPAGVNANFDERAHGFARAMREAGLPWSQGPIHGDDVASAVQDLLAKRPDITAVFAANDNFALSAIRGFEQMGRQVPHDVSVMGFDDIDLAGHLQPGLTTMAIDKVSMGRLAVDLLDFRLAFPNAATVVTTLVPRLVVRESVTTPSESGDTDGG